jgi:hypothetical protein
MIKCPKCLEKKSEYLKSGYCQECKKEVNAKYYRENRQAQYDRNKINREKYKKEIKDYKAERGCFCCEEKEPCCLDFHHINGKKEHNISKMSVSFGREKVFAEIAKCAVVCANCHRKIHAGIIQLEDNDV